jgi:hypothetical protein
LELENEKAQLQNKLGDIHALYTALVGDQRVSNQNTRTKRKEELNDRRSMLYQSQIIQLKRQLEIYKEIAQRKELFVYSAQEQAYMILEKFQKYVMSLESSQKKPELESLFKRIEALAKHISRQEQNHIDNIVDPLYHFTSDFVSPKSVLTLHKVGDGTTDHLNIAHISRLDIQLQTLYGKLSELEASLSTSFEPNVAPVFQKQVQSVFENCMNEIVSVMNALLSLSALVPATPLPKMDQAKLPAPFATTIHTLFEKMTPPLSEPVRSRIQPVLESLLEEFRTTQVVDVD